MWEDFVWAYVCQLTKSCLLISFTEKLLPPMLTYMYTFFFLVWTKNGVYMWFWINFTECLDLHSRFWNFERLLLYHFILRNTETESVSKESFMCLSYLVFCFTLWSEVVLNFKDDKLYMVVLLFRSSTDPPLWVLCL